MLGGLLTKSNLETMIDEMAERIVDSIGGADYGNILGLLKAKTKKDAERIGKVLTINKDQFSSLILNAHLYRKDGYCYKQHTMTHMAADLSEERLEQYVENRDFSKIIQKAFVERKHNCFHFFERAAEWHLFYFDFDDIANKHWKGGPHIHYISCLWRIDKNELLKQLGDRSYKIGGIHIRWLGIL